MGSGVVRGLPLRSRLPRQEEWVEGTRLWTPSVSESPCHPADVCDVSLAGANVTYGRLEGAVWVAE